MPFSDYNASAAANTNIAGKYTGENMQRGDIDAVLRQLAADGKLLSNDVNGISVSVTNANALAQTVAAIQDSYPNSAETAVPRGVTGHTSLVGGSGGTNGTFPIIFTGGGGSGATGTFTVTGGAITNITITGPGYGYTSAPTMAFTNSAGLTGASATAVIGFLVGSGRFYFAARADGSATRLYQNVLGTATLVTTGGFEVPSKTYLDAQVALVNSSQVTQEERINRALYAMQNQLPGPDKPALRIRVEKNRELIFCRPHDNQYRDGYTRRADDVAAFEMFNFRETLGLPPGTYAWGILSIWARHQGRVINHANWSASGLADAGATWDSGQVPSTFEPVSSVGKLADPVNATNYQLAGINHLNMGYSSASMTIDASITNVRDDPVNTVTPCDKFTFDQTWTYKTPDGTVAANVLIAHIFDPAAGNQCVVSTNQNFVGAPSIGVNFGYAAMLPFRICNRLQARSTAGVAGAVNTVGAGTGANVSLGSAARVTGWHTDNVGMALELELGATYAPFRINGVQQLYTLPAFALDNPAGPKVYVPTYDNSTNADDLTSKAINTFTAYNCVRANGA